MAWFDVRRSALRVARFETRARPWAWLKWPVYIFGGLYAFYLVVANAMINTGIIDWLANMSPRQLAMYVGRGWTVIPGRVHFEDYRIRFQDRNVQFFMTVDRGVIDIALFDLPRQYFHARRCKVEGVRYWMRHKVHGTAGVEERLAAYPPIPGVADLPLFDIGPPTPPLTDANYDLWTIQFDDVAATVKELWFLDGRYRGAGNVVGAFRLKPDREVWVGPATMELEPGALTVGPYQVMPDLSMRTEVLVNQFDPRVPKGLEIFEYINVDLDLRGHLPDTKFMALYLPPGVHVEGEKRLLETKFHLQHGRIRQGTTVRLAAAETTVRAAPFRFEGPLAFAVDAKDAGEGTVIATTKVGGKVYLPFGDKNAKGKPLVITVAAALGEMHTQSALLTKDPNVGMLRGEVTHATTPVDGLAPLLPAGMKLHGGEVELSGQGHYEPERAMEGATQVTLRDVGVDVAGIQSTVRGTIDAAIPRQAVESRGHRGTVRVAFDNVSVRSTDKTVGSAMLVEGQVEEEARGKERLLRMPFRVNGPSGHVVAAALGGTAWFVKLGAPLLEGDPLKAKGELTMEGDRVGLRVAEGRVGSLEMRGGLLSRGDSMNGAWLLRSGLLSVGLALEGGGVGPQFFASDGWLKEKLDHLDALSIAP